MKKRNYNLLLCLGLVIAVLGCKKNNESTSEEIQNVEMNPAFIEAVNQYEALRDYQESMAAVEKNGKWGFIDIEGNLKVPCIYNSVLDFNEGLAAVEKDGKWGYVDTEGNLKIPCNYDYAWDFREGLAAVQNNYKRGVINKNGEVILPIIYSGVDDFSDGMARVWEDQHVIGEYYISGQRYEDSYSHIETKYGYTDRQGTIVIPIKYNSCHSFSEGLAAVEKDGKWGFINKNDEVIVPFRYDSAERFSEGLAAVEKDGKWGFVDTEGNLKIPCNYDYVGDFSEGLAAVEKNGKCGFINKNGEVAVPIRYGDVSPFKNGFAYVNKNNRWENNGWGFINKEGQGITPFKYDVHYNGEEPDLSRHYFSEGLAVVINNGKYGYVNTNGEEVIPCIYNDAYVFAQGFAVVLISYDSYYYEDYEDQYFEDYRYYYGYIDRNGKTTFSDGELMQHTEFEKQHELKKDQEEEKERIQREGPDWLQGRWKVSLTDDYGNSHGTMYSTFNHGTLTIEMGDMIFEYPYTLSDDLTELRFANDGKYFLKNEKVISANGETMTKVSDSTSSNSSSSNKSSYQNDKELEIMNKLKELGEEGRALLPKIEQLYRSQQAYGVGGNPEANFSLREALDQLLKIKNEQIKLAQQLGDAQLVKEYKEQRDKVQESADLMLYGRSGSVQLPY